MNSFLYLISKFTEEFLLLTAAAIFGLLSVYCYEWVIKKRRLGAARDQIPASMVKAYLNQLIAEAQSVRVQLFGLMQTHPEEAANFEDANKMLASLSPVAAPASGIPGDLTDRLRALQTQLADKESLVVNINIEKTKLLEELETLRQNQKNAALTTPGAEATDALAKKVKDLESRLEEYSLFEDDLANLKRLQQENIALKKKLEEMGGSLASTTPDLTSTQKSRGVSQNDIDSLLEGKPATPPVGLTEPLEPASPPPPSAAAPALMAVPNEPVTETPSDATPLVAAKEPEPAPEKTPEMSPSADVFENLVSSVEKSLDSPALAPSDSAQAESVAVPAEPLTLATPGSPEAASPQAPAAKENLAAKTDDELLKEFENLLNS
jgi:hypothetical protein